MKLLQDVTKIAANLETVVTKLVSIATFLEQLNAKLNPPAATDGTAPSIDVSTVGTIEELLSLIPANNIDITSLLTMTFSKMKELQSKA